MGGLRVLITNHSLAKRSGTEVYVRDLALGLLRRGHTPVVYTTRTGEAARRLRDATIPVVDDLNRISTPPALIHGQHHAETMTALLHFDETPALFFCHGWLPWEETPPRHPRILRYLAVDDTCRDRLLFEAGVPEARARVLLNAVDLARFRQRAPLPPRPRRALLFSNRADHHAAVVREACERAGIALDVAGGEGGRGLEEPEKVLGQYDLVFAKARCALEALAVGASVVLCDAAGAGPLVTSAELARLRRLNFGIRTLQNELRPETLAREISRYDAADAAEVSRRVRASAGQEEAFDELVSLYREIVEEHALAPRDAAAEGRAAAEYLRWLAASLNDSTTARLRERVLGLPVVGALARAAARSLKG